MPAALWSSLRDCCEFQIRSEILFLNNYFQTYLKGSSKMPNEISGTVMQNWEENILNRGRNPSCPQYLKGQGLKLPHAWISKKSSPSPHHHLYRSTVHIIKIITNIKPWNGRYLAQKPGGKESGFNSHSIWLWAFWKTRQKGKHHELHGWFIYSLV